MRCLRWLCISYLLTVTVRGEMFTALVEMEKALDTQRQLSLELKDFVKAEIKKLNTIMNIANQFAEQSSAGLRDAQSFISHPLNAFVLVKRLTVDWEKVHTLVNKSSTEFESRTAKFQDSLPTLDDLKGSAAALFRLQETYGLSTAQVAQGNFTYGLSTAQIADGNFTKGAITSSTLNADECFQLGRRAYNFKDYHQTASWMTEALERNDREDQDKSLRIEILAHLSFAAARLGNASGALQLSRELEGLNPGYPNAAENIRYYQKVLKDYAETGKMQLVNPAVEKSVTQEHADYEALCRGEDIMSNPYEHQLRCRYETKSHPLLLLAPLKTEELYLDPLIVVYRDMMNDQEMEKAKELARPKLERATVLNTETRKKETTTYRISKSAWLADADDPIIQRITNRVEAATGLDQGTAEELQVVNYGIGGHYEPHIDFSPAKDPYPKLGWGNRIATILFYMSDVTAGGATVFPRIGVKVWPEKGSAAFWWNLREDGAGDYGTRHAACPVLLGDKWVANKWIHERGQEFRRPCKAKDIPKMQTATKQRKEHHEFVGARNDRLKTNVSKANNSELNTVKH